jgi:hypothetical protein
VSRMCVQRRRQGAGAEHGRESYQNTLCGHHVSDTGANTGVKFRRRDGCRSRAGLCARLNRAHSTLPAALWQSHFGQALGVHGEGRARNPVKISRVSSYFVSREVML